MNETVRRIVGPTILLSSGNYFDYEAPETSAFTIEDIAHGLSMTCRFAGHCIRHYSVAQHSVHISNLVPPEHAYQGLMHDAPEFAVGDMAKPLKVMLPEYSVIEKRVEVAVFARFGVQSPLPPTIKEADIRMLATEQRQLMLNRDDWDYTRGRPVFDFEIPVWSPEYAKLAFLARYAELTGAASTPTNQVSDGGSMEQPLDLADAASVKSGTVTAYGQIGGPNRAIDGALQIPGSTTSSGPAKPITADQAIDPSENLSALASQVQK